MSEPKKLAVLIDADNSSHKNITLILQEIVKLGLPTVKRVYGDWSGEISVMARRLTACMRGVMYR